MKFGLMTYACRTAVLVIAVVLVWRIVAVRLSNYHVDQMSAGVAGSVNQALLWNPSHPQALLRKALDYWQDDAEKALALLQQAYQGNPAAARPLLLRATLAQQDENPQQAAALITQAGKLTPANANIQKAIALYWASEGELQTALQHWSQALNANPRTSDELFPILMNMAESPARTVFNTLAVAPPAWWERFFVMVAQRALDLETVRALYSFRQTSSGVPPSDLERQAFTQRLQKEGLITEAYLTWISGLSDIERAHLGIIYNGGFELETTQSGFGWYLRPATDIIIKRGNTYGIKDEKALHLHFKRRERPVRRVVHQPLFLAPGTYRLTGMVRTDSLDSAGGLQWVVRCTKPVASVLGESARFLGSSEWERFQFEFEVPADCSSQELRLGTAGTRTFEHKINGEIWFDGLAMQRIRWPSSTRADTVGSIASGRSTD